MKTQTLAVNEIFGPTFQGEGVNLGMPCFFLRLAGCNLACVWCDTRYAWDWKAYDSRAELHPMSVDEVEAMLSMLTINSPNLRNLVISGGEPMLQQVALATLTERLHARGWHTEIETAGTIAPLSESLVNHYTISPKLTNSGNKKSTIRPSALAKFMAMPNRCFKFVTSQASDFDEIDQIVNDFGLWPVYIMPEGQSASEIDGRLQLLAEEAIKRGYYLTTRLHVTIYGKKRAI